MILVEAVAGQINLVIEVSNDCDLALERRKMWYIRVISQRVKHLIFKLLHVTVERFRLWIFWFIPLYFRCKYIREVELSTQASRELEQNQDQCFSDIFKPSVKFSNLRDVSE